MTISFYDVRSRQNIETEVIGKVVINLSNGQKRHALKGKTEEGGTLTRFVSAADFEAADVPVIE